MMKPQSSARRVKLSNSVNILTAADLDDRECDNLLNSVVDVLESNYGFGSRFVLYSLPEIKLFTSLFYFSCSYFGSTFTPGENFSNLSLLSASVGQADTASNGSGQSSIFLAPRNVLGDASPRLLMVYAIVRSLVPYISIRLSVILTNIQELWEVLTSSSNNDVDGDSDGAGDIVSRTCLSPSGQTSGHPSAPSNTDTLLTMLSDVMRSIVKTAIPTHDLPANTSGHDTTSGSGAINMKKVSEQCIALCSTFVRLYAVLSMLTNNQTSWLFQDPLTHWLSVRSTQQGIHSREKVQSGASAVTGVRAAAAIQLLSLVISSGNAAAVAVSTCYKHFTAVRMERIRSTVGASSASASSVDGHMQDVDATASKPVADTDTSYLNVSTTINASTVTSCGHCLICLSPPTVPTTTPCGHILCWGCLVRYSLGEPDSESFLPRGKLDRENVTSRRLVQYREAVKQRMVTKRPCPICRQLFLLQACRVLR